MAYYVAAVCTIFGLGCVIDGLARLLGAGLADETTRTGGDPRGTATVLLVVGIGLLVGAVASVIAGVSGRASKE
jgi:hypothetical protein